MPKPLYTPYKEPMQQKWTKHFEWLTDQLGYGIKKEEMFELYHKGEFLIRTYSLEAAKEISLVLINDKINNK